MGQSFRILEKVIFLHILKSSFCTFSLKIVIKSKEIPLQFDFFPHIIAIIIEALSQLPTMLGSATWILFHHFSLSWAKSLDRLHFLRYIRTNSIRVFFGLPLFLEKPSTCIEKLFLTGSIVGPTYPKHKYCKVSWCSTQDELVNGNLSWAMCI